MRKIAALILRYFLQLIITKDGNMELNFADDLVKGTCITNGGAVVHERMIANN